MQWISVEDKLPKKGTWCLVFSPRYYQVAEYTENEKWAHAYGCNAWNVAEVTHWLPIPKPPQHN